MSSPSTAAPSGRKTTGCGGVKKVKVHGPVTRNGQPLKVPKTTLVTITFAPVDQSTGQTFPAKFDYDQGTYEVTVPAGDYRASVLVAPPKEAVISSPMSASKTYELQKDEEVTLELGK